MGIQQVITHQDQSKSKFSAKTKVLLLIIGIVGIGANLRAPLTTVGPLIDSIRDSLGISNLAVGSLTTLPLLAFAILSPFAPKLSRRFGMEMVLFLSLIILTIGILLRYITGVGTLFAGTLLIGLGISIGNVLIPSLIKLRFPQKIGLITGIYAVSMNLSAAIASGMSVPIAAKIGWNGSLSYWGIISLIAILFWLPQVKFPKGSKKPMPKQNTSVNIWKSRLAWNVTCFMGLQSLIFYTIVAWLPEILKQQGVTPSMAGWMLSIMQFAVIPFTFIVPIIAGRMKNQLPLVIITACLFFFGIFGVLYGSSALIPLWVIMIGIAAGCAFSLAMMFFSLRTKSTHEAAELSGMAQSFGYLLAAIGPALFGILHDVTHSWSVPLWMLMIVSVLILLAGLVAGRNEQIKTNSPA